MTNYFCFVCQKYFLSQTILQEHAIYAGHSNHDIGMTMYTSAIPKNTQQCVCGAMFNNEENLFQHLLKDKCNQKKQKQQTCHCGCTEFKVFNKQGIPFYQCVNCTKRNSFETVRELQNMPDAIQTSQVDSDGEISENNSQATIQSKTHLLKILENPRATIEFAKQTGLLMESPKCPECTKPMVLCKQSQKKDGYVYSCYKYVLIKQSL